MARRKDRLIEQVTHGPFKADIRMDDDGRFYCDYGSHGKSGTLLEVRAWAQGVLRDCCSIKWEPVLRVQIDNEDTRVNDLRESCSNLELYIERYHIAWDGKKWIVCPWVVQPPGHIVFNAGAASEMNQADYPMSEGDLMAQRISKSRDFSVPGAYTATIDWPLHDGFLHDKVYWVKYTEERWETMRGILAKMRELRGGINKLLGTEQGWERLAIVAASRMLTDQKSPETASESTSAEPPQSEEQSVARSASRYRRSSEHGS